MNFDYLLSPKDVAGSAGSGFVRVTLPTGYFYTETRPSCEDLRALFGTEDVGDLTSVFDDESGLWLSCHASMLSDDQ